MGRMHETIALSSITEAVSTAINSTSLTSLHTETWEFICMKKANSSARTHKHKHTTAQMHTYLAQASLWTSRYRISRQRLRSACSGEHMALPLICSSLELFHMHWDTQQNEYRWLKLQPPKKNIRRFFRFSHPPLPSLLSCCMSVAKTGIPWMFSLITPARRI